MEKNTQPTFGNHIPHYLREELAQAYQKQQQGKPEEGPKEPQTETEQLDHQPQSQPNPETAPEQTSPQAQTEPQGNSTESPAPHSDKDNDVKAMKGRLKKKQAEYQQLNARLIEESEARERAEARLRELEQQAQQNAQSTPPKADPQGLSDDDLEELKAFNPDLYLKLKAQQQAQQQTPKAPPVPTETTTAAQPHKPQPQVGQMSERDRIWYSEVQREIPELQGLLFDAEFQRFAQGKEDWTGATGLDLIQKAGEHKDVRLIPVIRNLLDEYKQSKDSSPATVTVPPSKGAPAKPKVNTPKTMTEKDEAHAEMLSRLGKTKELKAFLAQFKK